MKECKEAIDLAPIMWMTLIICMTYYKIVKLNKKGNNETTNHQD